MFPNVIGKPLPAQRIYSSPITPVLAGAGVVVAGIIIYLVVKGRQDEKRHASGTEEVYGVSTVMTAREHYAKKRQGITKKGPKFRIKLVSGHHKLVFGDERLWHRGHGEYSVYTGTHDKAVTGRGCMQGSPKKWLHTGDKVCKRR